MGRAESGGASAPQPPRATCSTPECIRNFAQNPSVWPKTPVFFNICEFSLFSNQFWWVQPAELKNCPRKEPHTSCPIFAKIFQSFPIFPTCGRRKSNLKNDSWVEECRFVRMFVFRFFFSYFLVFRQGKTIKKVRILFPFFRFVAAEKMKSETNKKIKIDI